MGGWIGVDLDGTLAEHHSGEPYSPLKVGKPIPRMVERIHKWLASGLGVRIVTARIHGLSPSDHLVVHHAITQWLLSVGLPKLPIQSNKDYSMLELWDDRAVQVVPNTGRRADGKPD